MDKLLEIARKQDREDELRRFRDEFCIPSQHDGSEQRYFCGHSLGLQPKSAGAAIDEDLDAWRKLAVRGHFEGALPWMNQGEGLSRSLADLFGAQAAEIAVMNTLTVNLHLMMVSFFRPRGKRCKILIERHAFPSDRYAVESQLRFHGLDPADCLLELGPQAGSHIIDESEIEHCLQSTGDEIALVLWPGVQYVSGQAFDLGRVARAARGAGALIGFDLAHYAGNLPLSLHDSGCDFAAWCHYKYLNSGPGAVGGCFIHQRHHGRSDLPRLHGWWGNDRESRFRMEHGFDPAAGAQAWQVSNPPVLAMSPIRASLEIFQEAGTERLRQKSMSMTDFLLQGIQTYFDERLEVITPADPLRRGCQLSIRVRSGRDEGRLLFKHLESSGVITDWREPDVIRVAPAPLYNSFGDCYALLQHLSTWPVFRGKPPRRSA